MLSIIVPTYNEEEYLPRLLASIRSQAFSDYEIIVADAHSKDRTREIAKAFGAKVVDGGLPGPGRNLGAKAASGDLYLFLDADVILPDVGWLGRKVGQFRKRRLSVGTCLIKPMSTNMVDVFSHHVFNVHMLASQLFMAHAPGFCIFATARLHRRIGGFDEGVTFAEDHDYVQRASLVGRFRVLYGARVRVSVRRFERDGRLAIFKKYLLAELHILTKGEIRGPFDYGFGYPKGLELPASSPYDVSPKTTARTRF